MTTLKELKYDIQYPTTEHKPRYPFLQPEVPKITKRTLTPAEIIEFKLDVPEGWQVEVEPVGAEFKLNYKTPDKWILKWDGSQIDPMGKVYTSEEIKQSKELTEQFGKLFPEQDIRELMSWAETDPARFTKTFQEIGDTAEARAILKRMGLPDEDIYKFYAPAPEPTITKLPEEKKWYEKIFAPIEKYIVVPWSVSVSAVIATAERQKEATDIELLTKLDEATKKHGWKAMFSDEVAEAYHKWEAPAWGIKGVTEILNPAWFLPVGGTVGLVARAFSKVPVLGKTLIGVARGIQVAEEVAALPVTLPLKGVGKVIGKFLKPEAKRLLLHELPTDAMLEEFMFKNDWFKKLAQKIPALGKIAPASVAGVLPETLVVKGDIQNAIVKEVSKRVAIQEIGQSTKGQALAYMKELGSTVEILGVKDAVCNPKLVRPKPEFPQSSLALGDVVQAPERYIFAHKNGYAYAKRAQQVCKEMYELAAKEGVDIPKVGLEPFEEYVHWVCTGKLDKDGVLEVTRKGTRAVGGIVSSMKHRRMESMMDGLKLGYKYADDLETYVASYFDDIFKVIADKRFGEGLSKVTAKIPEMLPTTPLERLGALYPEAKATWEAVSKKMADLGYVFSGIKRMIRGEKLPVATLSAIERRFPDVGKRLRELLPKQKIAPEYMMKAEVLVKKYKPLLGELEKAQLAKDFVAEDQALKNLESFIGALTKDEVKVLDFALQSEQFVTKAPLPKVEAVVPEGVTTKTLASLSKEFKGQIESLRPEWWKAKYKRAEAMEIVRRPILGREEGMIVTSRGTPHPMFQGHIYPKDIAEKASALLNEEVNAFLRLSASVGTGFRLQQAALDISAGMIQGFIGSFSHPLIATRAQLGAIFTLLNPKVFSRYLVKNAASMNERIFYLGAQRPFEYFESLGAIQRLGAKIPGGKAVLGQTYGRAEAAFSMWSTVFKDQMWQVGARNWIRKGQGAEFARLLERMTGSMSFRQLGMPANLKSFLSGWVSFAPQYRASIAVYMGDVFKGGMTGAQVRGDIAKAVTAATVSYVAFCEVTGRPAYLNPYKDGKKFMSIEVDGHWIGLGGAVVSIIRGFADTTSSMLSIGENEPMDFLTLDKWKNPLIRFWYSQSAVLPGMLNEIIQRRDYMGYPLETAADWARWTASQFTPIWLQDIVYDRSGVPWTPLAALGEFVGLRTSPQTRWETFNDLILSLDALKAVADLTEEQKKRIDKGESILSVLDRYQKMALINAFPELKKPYEDAQADALLRSSKERRNYETAFTKVRNEVNESLKKAFDIGVKVGEKDTRYLRQRYSEIMKEYAAKVEILREIPEWKPFFDEIDKAQVKKLADAEAFDVAYWEYIQKVVAPDFETPEGEPDFEAYEKALVEWRTKWGENYYSKVLYIQENNKADLPAWAIKIWKGKKVINESGYWKLPYKPVYQMKEEKEVPAEYLALWRQYKTLKTDEERDAYREANPDIAKDWRAEYRGVNPEVDAVLALWKYGGKLQTKEAYNLVKNMAKELGIDVSISGLPPDNLVEKYFKYNETVSKYGGSSAQAQLYKLENKDWFEWGKQPENMGWLDIETPIKALRISVKWYDLDKQYESYSDRASVNYIATDEGREDARAALLADPKNLGYDKDRRRRDAYNLKGFPETSVEAYADYYTNPKLKKPIDYDKNLTWYEDDWFLMDNMELVNAMLQLYKDTDGKQGWEKKDFTKVPTRDVWGLYLSYRELAIGGTGATSEAYAFRGRHPDLDAWGVLAQGWKAWQPPKIPKTKSEKAAEEAQRQSEIESQKARARQKLRELKW